MTSERGPATVVVTLLVAALLFVSAGPVRAEQPVARGIDRVCPPPDGSGPSTDPTDPTDPDAPAFTDLGTAHAPAIRCASAYGLVAGYADGTFRPADPVTRGQLATFLAVWLETATGIALARPDAPAFTDIDTTVHAAAIGALAGIEVLGGRADGTFAPDAGLNRGQLARALVNAVSYADIFAVGGPLPPAAAPDGPADLLTDVAGTTFADEIGALVAAGIAIGGEDGTFGPGDPVTRGQLATFLLRAADYLDRHGRWRPTATTVVLVADLHTLPGTDVVRPRPPLPTAVLVVNAFNGTLAYILDLSTLPGPFADGAGAAIRVAPGAGSDAPDGSAVVRLLDGPALQVAAGDRTHGGVVTGVIAEADSPVRFADLLADPGRATLVVATDARPDGAVGGPLQRTGDRAG